MADGSGRIAVIPYCPRGQFRHFHDRTERWACIVAHRRAGKTVACINDLIRSAVTSHDPNGRWGYLAPLYNQAKDVAWDYLKRFSEPVRSGIPNESELRVDLFNGNRIRLYGADNPERLRGGYFNGIILDEYADMRPSVWGEVIRPALADKKGWAVFIGTPRGRQGLYDVWAGKNQWKDVELYRLMLKASETGILSKEELAEAARTMTPEQYEQEFECSFEAAIQGAVYGKLMAQAEADKRVCPVHYDPSVLVHTGWDLGIGDPTAIWFAQTVGRETRLIDYYESSGVDIAHYAGVLKAKGYNYGGHILPHDAAPKELTSGKSLKDVLESLGVRPLHVQPQSRVEDGINAARLRIPMCVFDAKKCERGIEALKLYRYEFDEKLNTLKNKPVHDWTSHAADAFRYLSEGLGRGLTPTGFSGPIKLPRQGIV
jgi:phage terminase large subunit